MARLVDAGLWIDFGRARSPQFLKRFVAPYIFAPDACLAEPIAFEVLRYANEEETRKLQAQFQTLPMLTTPADLWSEATTLGQRCRRHGITAGSLDFIIACVALHYDVEIVTFDADFERIATVCALRVTRLSQPTE
jgi:predicted nucleic acid-binding protein